MSIMTLPYTNLHEINLDWIIEQVKRAQEITDTAYSPENPPPYPVRSVNGQTGDVTIIIPVTSVNGKTGPVVTPFINPGDAIQRIDTQSPNEEAGIQRVLNNSGIVTLRVTHTNNMPEAYIRYSLPNGQNTEYRLVTLADIPESSGVVSVNGMTGVVVINGANLIVSNTDDRTIAFAIDAAEQQLADQLDRILGTEEDITTIQRGLAILANGNTHAAVAAGQFVFVKSHPTLTPGVYIATANIATNEALTSSNLSTVPNGGLNALKSNIDTINSNMTMINSVTISNTSLNRARRYKIGRTVIIYGLVAFSTTTAEISNLWTNNSGDYIPVTLTNTDNAETKFFNLIPNATTVSMSGLTPSNYYIISAVYGSND